MITEQEQDEMDEFTNLPGGWEKEGDFRIGITDRTRMHRFPKGIKVVNNAITLSSGKIKMTPGSGFLLTGFGPAPIRMRYFEVKFIRYGHGGLLWVNDHYRVHDWSGRPKREK